MSESTAEKLRAIGLALADLGRSISELAGESDSQPRTSSLAEVVSPPEETKSEAPASGESTKVYKMEDVRAALVEARRSRGVNVTELLKEFGVENFSAFPAGRYGELLAKLNGC